MNLAKKGNKEAQGALGEYYYRFGETYSFDKKKSEKYYAESFKWYEKQDNKYMIGIMYFSGKGVKKSMNKGMECFEKIIDMCIEGILQNKEYKHQFGVVVNTAREYVKEDYEWLKAEKNSFLKKADKLQSKGEIIKSLVFKVIFSEAENVDKAKELRDIFISGRGVQINVNEAGSFQYIANRIRFERVCAGAPYSVPLQYEVGNCYYNGIGVVEDYNIAISYFRRAAEKGHAGAQNGLGKCYFYGHGVAKNVSEAVRLFKLSAEKGDAGGQCSLGYCYEAGVGVTKNITEAVRLYRLAAGQDDSRGQVCLGYCYEDGVGVTKNITEAVRLYRLAAGQDDSRGQFCLGVCYEYGTGVTKNITEAVRLYRLAAGQGDEDAQNNLGVCYFYGEGVTKNIPEAIKIWKYLATRGHAGALHNLASSYETGKGVTQNLVEAIKLYKLAMARGEAGSYYRLGGCYEDGRGVAKNIPEAVRLYRIAAAKGLINAKAALKRLGYSETEGGNSGFGGFSNFEI